MGVRLRPGDLEWLGLEADATEADVIVACQRKRVLYQPDSLATYDLLSDEERAELLKTIDGILGRLGVSGGASAADVRVGSGAPPAAPEGPEPSRAERPGAYLRYHRLNRGVPVGAIAADTKIPEQRLRDLENEAAGDLPAPVFVRGFVTSMARFLELDDPEGLAVVYLDVVMQRNPER